jgi:REP-associated tyrosine transposase
MASGRLHNWGDIHMITFRCEEGRFFLKPTMIIVQLVAYWFARSINRYGSGIEVYAFCFLGNHFHLLLRDTGGKLAVFLGYFLGNIGKAVNRSLDRGPAHFWQQGHYNDQIIHGEKSFWNKYVYITTNAVKSGLVRRTEDWLGFNSFEAAVKNEKITGIGLDRTAHHNANRGNIKRDESEFIDTFEFELTPPPMLAQMTAKEQTKTIYKMVKHAEVHYLSRRNNKQVLGMAKVMSTNPLRRPERIEKRPQRRFVCDVVEEEKEREEGYRDFIGQYKTTYGGFFQSSIRGKPFHGEWPVGSYPPSFHEPVTEDR